MSTQPRFAGLLLGLLVATSTWAQGVIVPDWYFHPERPVIRPPDGTVPLRVLSDKITTEVNGFAAVTNVEEAFQNHYGARIEGTFLFPLPEDAAVTNFSMTVNGQEVGGELLDARKAREVYENIVRQVRDPGLLEYVGRQLFRARIFPIEPNETKRVKLEYTQSVPAEDGLAKFVFPLRARAFHDLPFVRPPGPRPIPMRDRRPGWSPLPPESDIQSLSVDVRIESPVGIKSVYSPTHDIDLHRLSDHVVRVGYEGTKVAPEDDFVLYWQLSDESFGLSLMAHRDAAEPEGTFMLLLAPKSELREQEVVAKDIVFVFDTSGSMAGAKIGQAQNALKYCLNNLNPGDRFSVLSFSTAVRAFTDSLVSAEEPVVKRALEFVGDLKARGGTNIDEALEAALKMLPEDTARPAMVLFLTDGLPTVGETKVARILENVGEHNRSDARMFVFGVGDDVNTMLLDRLSNDNHGTRTFVKPNEDIETSVSNLYAKITSPVLSDLKLTIDGVKVDDLHPLELPDLFRGSQLSVLGRYEGEGTSTVTLSGRAGAEEVSFNYSVDFPRRERQHSFLPRLWATRRIGYLLDQIRLHGEDRELVDEVVRLATRYGVLTPYTSYLVLEPGEHADSLALEAIRGRRVTAAPAQTAPGAPGGMGGGGFYGGERPTEEATGAGAVARSEAEGLMRQADRAAGPGAAGNLATKSAAGRTFYLIDDVWVDSDVPKDDAGLHVVKIKFGSDAYFDLLGLRDEMRDVLAVGDALKVKFGETLLVVGEEGEETLSEQAKTWLAQAPNG